MLRQLLIASLLLVSAYPSLNAQFSWGISGGVNATIWDWRLRNIGTSAGYEAGFGWRAAAQLGYQLSPMLQIRGSLFGQQIANRISDVTDINGNTVPNSRISERYRMIGLTVQAKVSPGKQEQGVYLLAGPGVGYLLDGTRRYTAGLKPGEEGPATEPIELKDSQLYRNQWSADIGVGYDLAIGNQGMLALEFRYQLGLGAISRSPNIDSRLHTALVQVGYARKL